MKSQHCTFASLNFIRCGIKLFTASPTDTSLWFDTCEQRCYSNFLETGSVTGSLNLGAGSFEQKCRISTNQVIFKPFMYVKPSIRTNRLRSPFRRSSRISGINHHSERWARLLGRPPRFSFFPQRFPKLKS